jgi:hypothetical protein
MIRRLDPAAVIRLVAVLAVAGLLYIALASSHQTTVKQCTWQTRCAAPWGELR